LRYRAGEAFGKRRAALQTLRELRKRTAPGEAFGLRGIPALSPCRKQRTASGKPEPRDAPDPQKSPATFTQMEFPQKRSKVRGLRLTSRHKMIAVQWKAAGYAALQTLREFSKPIASGEAFGLRGIPALSPCRKQRTASGKQEPQDARDPQKSSATFTLSILKL
jgi:hypothetical protein